MIRTSYRRRSRRVLRLGMEMLEPRLNLALTVPAFSSLPGANHTIYLDFDGHVTTGTSWNGSYQANSINSPAYSTDADTANFSAAELTNIERAWKRTSEDFAPFQVNVTTVAPTVEDLRNTGGGDTKWGIRVVVTKDVAFGCGCGGIAYINSFNWNSDTPVFVFNSSELGVSEAASHEVGHSLGLAHDGTSSLNYYQGHGLGTDTAYWAPIMGVSYYVDVSQWDKGEYVGTNNGGSVANYNKGPDDLNVITTYNGFGYKADDHGNTTLTASALNVAGTSVSGSGLITTRTDADYFQFTTGAGTVTLNINPAALGPNLDIAATLYNGNGTLVTSSNPLQAMNASISANLPAGQYFLKVDGTGAGDPSVSPPTGYTDYASIGPYTISGSIVATSGDVLNITPTSASKNEGNSGTTGFTFTVNRSGNTTGTSSVNYVVTGSGGSPASANDFAGGVFPSGSLTFAPGVMSQVITVNVQGDTTSESSEGFTVSLTNPSPTTAIGTGSASGTILNDDTPPAPPTFAIAATSASKAEGTSSNSTPFQFTITRSGDTTGSSSVRYSGSASGSAKASGSDFVGGFPSSVLVNFGPGVSSVDITLNVNADSKREKNENFKVTLSSPVGGAITTSTANGTILNDDGTGAAEDDDDEGEDLVIAVADPLWLFVPPQYLSAEQLSVPVMTWINGTPFVGDLAHDHGNQASHDEHFERGDELISDLAASGAFARKPDRLLSPELHRETKDLLDASSNTSDSDRKRISNVVFQMASDEVLERFAHWHSAKLASRSNRNVDGLFESWKLASDASTLDEAFADL